MTSSNDQRLLLSIRRLGMVRPSDLESRGVPRARLYGLVRQGLLQRIGRGLYIVDEQDITESHSLAMVAKRTPGAVVCLLSALQFHRLTTQLPHEVWIAIAEKARRPRIDYPRLRVMRFSALALTEGVEVHEIEGVSVRVTSVAKTVADCFKYRNKVGLDVALEALRDAWRERRMTMEQLFRCARVCRVDRVMRPYVEALVA